jgi:membrane-associated protein
MKYRNFVFYNVMGGLLWIWSLLFTGYFLGRYIPGIDEHIEIVIIVVVFLSILPGIIHYYKERKRPVPVPTAALTAAPVPEGPRDAAVPDA